MEWENVVKIRCVCKFLIFDQACNLGDAVYFRRQGGIRGPNYLTAMRWTVLTADTWGPADGTVQADRLWSVRAAQPVY